MKYSVLSSLLLISGCQAFQAPRRPIRGSISLNAAAKKSSKGPKTAAKKTSAKKKGARKKKAPVEVAEPVPVTASATATETFPTPKANKTASDPGVWMGPQVEIPDTLDFDLTGGRPGAIIESESDLERKAKIFDEIESGDKDRKYPAWFDEYGRLEEDEQAEYDTDDPDAIDASTLGYYDFKDLQAKFDYEWDPETEVDPNLIQDTTGFVQETEKDEEGVEVGYDPLFGPSNPVDTRTKIGAADSYMVDQTTKNDEMLTPEFFQGDPEIRFNEEVIQLRKSLDIIESYTDEFLPQEMVIPRHVAKWHGYPEQLKFEPKNYTNNRFTDPKNMTNFDAMTPHRARTKAIEMARSNNAEWLPQGVSQKWHNDQREIYEKHGTLVGSLRKGECDPDTVELIQPALNVLGSSAELLSIEQGTVFRFHYHGLIKNKHGMACWTETLIRDCGVDVTGVVFETGFRARDPAYDGGDPYYGLS